MRKRFHEQQSFMQPFISHEHGRELAKMDEILEEILREAPRVVASVQRDLAAGRNMRRGRSGMTAEQVLRVLMIKQLNGFSYEDLSFHLADSKCYRTFCRFGALDKTPGRSTLQENIKRLTPDTLQKLQEALVLKGRKSAIEDGKRIRIDCTVTESNIHAPSDSSLLWDTTRKLTSLMKNGKSFGVTCSDHTRKAKRRWVEIQNAGRMERRIPAYRDMIALAEGACNEALKAASLLRKRRDGNSRAARIATQLEHFEWLGRRVIDQTERRVLKEESVPASEKVVSIFEPHTDIIVKSRRDTEYGHKICLAAGASGLITDCVIERGNPADVTLTTRMIDHHIALFETAPEQVALDGGFASRKNLTEAKERGVKDVAFSKRCGMQIKEMVRSESTYNALRHFRAGVEGLISFLKRVVGLERCTWSGTASFDAYVLSSVATANLLLLARHALVT
jgi:IS5 family transposase